MNEQTDTTRSIKSRPDYGEGDPHEIAGDVARALLRPIGPRPNSPKKEDEEQASDDRS